MVYPSKHFIKTYFSTFTNDPSINKEVKTGPNVTGFHLARQILSESGDIEAIIDACTYETTSANPEDEAKWAATLLRGTMYMLTGRANEASLDFTEIIETPTSPSAYKANAHIKRAALYTQNEHHDTGFADFTAAEQLEPRNGDIYLQRGQVHTLLEQLPEAIGDFEKAIELSPQSCSAHVQKCYVQYRQAYLQQNQVQLYKAINECQKALTMFPNNTETYNVLAQILTEQQQYDKADELFETALTMSPTTASLYVHRGLMQLQWKGDIQKALEYLNQAIEIDNRCELAYETLGTIQVQRGQLENAVDLFEKALELTRSEMEMVHLYSLRNAAIAQLNVAKKLGLDLSSLSALSAVGL